MGGRWLAGRHGPSRQRPRGDRRSGGATGQGCGAGAVGGAVIGRDFDLDLLARATKTSEDDLLDILDAAAAVVAGARTGRHPGHYNFAHALIQHTLYEDLGPNRRARAHRQVAEALESLCGDRPGARVGELARHWFSASQPIDLVKAIDYSRQAGDAALAALAPADALQYYAQALDLYPQPPTPIRSWDSTWPSGSARPSARPVTPRFVRPSSTQLAGPPTSVTPSDSWPRPSPTTGALQHAGVIDAEKVEVLEMALERLPPAPRTGTRARHPVRGTRPRQSARASPSPGRRSPRHRRVLG